MADKCQITISYAIGKAEPMAVSIDTFGTGKVSDNIIENAVLDVFDFRPAEIIKTLNLKKPIYTLTATGGHFGKEQFSWERADKVKELRDAVFKG